MKRILLLLLVVTQSALCFSQAYNVDILNARKRIYLAGYAVDTAQNDTSFLYHIKSIPTSDAVARYIAGHAGGGNATLAYPFTQGRMLNGYGNFVPLHADSMSESATRVFMRIGSDQTFTGNKKSTAWEWTGSSSNPTTIGRLSGNQSGGVWYGVLSFENSSNSNNIWLYPQTMSAHREIIVPDASGTLALTSDSRFSDARTPTTHTHNASDVNAGVLAPGRLGSGTPLDGYKPVYSGGTVQWRNDSTKLTVLGPYYPLIRKVDDTTIGVKSIGWTAGDGINVDVTETPDALLVTPSAQVTPSNSLIFQNKGWQRRVTTIPFGTVGATVNVTASCTTDDEVEVYAAGPIVVNNPSATPTNSQPHVYQFRCNGTAQTISWGTKFSGDKPTTTIVGDVVWVMAKYNATLDAWVIASQGNGTGSGGGSGLNGTGFVSMSGTTATYYTDVARTSVANTYPVKQSYSATSTEPINIGGTTSDPASPSDGGIWHNQTTFKLGYRDGLTNRFLLAENVAATVTKKNLADTSNTFNYATTGSTSSSTQTITTDRRVNTLYLNGLTVSTTISPASMTIQEGTGFEIRANITTAGITIAFDTNFKSMDDGVPASLNANSEVFIVGKYNSYTGKIDYWTSYK